MKTIRNSLISSVLCSFRICCLAILFIGGGFARGADEGALTNVVQRLFESKLLMLSLKGPSAAREFGFQARLSRRGFPTAVMRVAADKDSAAIVIETTNGLPLSLMTRGLFVRCDPVHPGGLACYEGGTVLWDFVAGKEAGDIEFNAAFVAVDESPEVNLDLRHILLGAIAKGTNLSYDASTSALRVASGRGSVLEVVLSSRDVSNLFGATDIVLSTTNSALGISSIRLGLSPLRALCGVSNQELRSLGLPLRALRAKELSELNWSIPAGFPKDTKELEAATKLQDWIARRLAEANSSTNRHSWVPDFQKTKFKAEAGDVRAQANLGVMYFQGSGVPKDITEALKWFRKAADLGLPLACNYLGSIYDNGQGVPADSAQAARWYRRAAEQGNPVAQYALGLKYSKGEGVKLNYAESVRWLRKAAEQGLADAQYMLGGMYTYGLGVPTNLVAAVKWYRLAADQGNSSAQCNLGICLIAGMGAERDPAEACKWLTLADRQGEPRAKEALNQLFEGVNAAAIAEGKRRATAFKSHPVVLPDDAQIPLQDVR